jgi:hypothetical protein
MSTDTSIPSRSFLIMSEISTTCAQRHPRAQRSDARRAGSRRSAAAHRSTRGAHPALVELNGLDEGDGDGVRRMLPTHVRAHAPEELVREAEDKHVRVLPRARFRLSAPFRSGSGYRRHSEALPVIGAIQKRFRLSAPFRSGSDYRRHSEAVPVIGAIQKRFRLSAAFRSGSGYRRHSEAHAAKQNPRMNKGADNASVIDGSQNLTTAQRRRKRAQGTGRQETLTASFTSAMATILVGSLIPGRYLTFSCSCPPRAPRQRQVLTSW